MPGTRGTIRCPLATGTDAPFGQAAASNDRVTGRTTVLLRAVHGEVPDPLACLADVRRVLQAGGSLTVAETRRDSDFLSQRALRKLAATAGLTVFAIRGPRWGYLATLNPE